LDENDGTPLCPVGVEPPHLVMEDPITDDTQAFGTRRQRRRLLGWMSETFSRGSQGALGGTALATTVGPITGIAMALRVLFPGAVARSRAAATTSFLPAPRTHLRHRHRTSHEHPEALEPSVDELAARLLGTLENMGLTKGFAPLVVFLAHGASSSNNPHRSAYDCGACGGRNGGPNARLFARTANRADVREKLAEAGVVIPSSTHFLGGLHDTTSDAVTLYDCAEVPLSHRAQVVELRALLEEARAANAQERCRRFASAPRAPSPEQALRHVEERAADMSEARPELGHATNAACVVGRRSLTRGLFLDRRCFLVSYSPEEDEDGRVLERVLSAVVPVCGGINLEYYFSRVDNTRLGAGTKLPHNVTGFIGVMDGPTSDLRTGLPRQMIEVHEPVRLLMVIEAKAEVVDAIVARNAVIRELIDNEWIRVAVMRPADQGIDVLERDGFEAYLPSARDTPVVPSFLTTYLGRDGFLDPVLSDSADPARAPGVRHQKGSASHAA
ncbi:MAG: putative inorganic carbon transporter subunit DabA, partial [Byssovorax sp.]